MYRTLPEKQQPHHHAPLICRSYMHHYMHHYKLHALIQCHKAINIDRSMGTWAATWKMIFMSSTVKGICKRAPRQCEARHSGLRVAADTHSSGTRLGPPSRPSYHHTIIPSCHHAIIPSYHHTIIPSCHHTIIPSYHHTIIPPMLEGTPLCANSTRWDQSRSVCVATLRGV